MTDLDVAAWCDGVARAVRTGASLATAVRECEAHPGVAPVTAPVMARLSRGQSLSAALRATSAGSAGAIGLALTVLRSCAELGGPAASPLERVAATLRGRNAIREEQLAQSAQARMSARVHDDGAGRDACAAGRQPTPNVRSAIGTPPGFAAVSVGCGPERDGVVVDAADRRAVRDDASAAVAGSLAAIAVCGSSRVA